MKNLKKLRMMAGCNQFRLAAATRIERSRISLIECGHVRPSVEEKVAIRKALERAMQKNSSEFSRLLLNV